MVVTARLRVSLRYIQTGDPDPRLLREVPVSQELGIFLERVLGYSIPSYLIHFFFWWRLNIFTPSHQRARHLRF